MGNFESFMNGEPRFLYVRKKSFSLLLLSLLSLKSANGWLTACCNEIFSDSTGDSSDSKKAFRAKNHPKTLRFSLTRCYLPQVCISLAAPLLPISSSTAHHPQYYCGAFAVIWRTIRRHPISMKSYAEY